MKTFEFKPLLKPGFNSKIRTDEVKNKERWLGYFLGPALVATVHGAVGGSYLNAFYTDVLHLNLVAAGVFLMLMPILSKVLDAITNVMMGRFVDNTKSVQGKARPWILISGPLLMLSMILLFAVPTSNVTVTCIWVTCSYNLYFCISYTMYNLSNVVTVPLSTRDSKKRDTLAMAQSMGINMVSGLVLAVVFPSFVLPYAGVDQSRWIKVMFILSILAVLGTLVQYFFTKERVTEEAATKNEETVSLVKQIKGCLSSKYWIMIILAFLLYLFANSFQSMSMHYYSNWVLGTYNDGRTLSILNIIGQAMLGPGVLILWPLVKKIGKQKVFVIGGIIACIGGVLGALNAHNMGMVLGALTIRSIGNLPLTYVLLSVLADALDHVEYINGFRCDGFSSSVYSILITVTAGVGTGIFNLGLSQTGYVAPNADGSWVAQSEAVQNYFITGMFIVPAVCALLIAIIFITFNLEKKLPAINEEMKARRGNAE